jgi:hypothetical protein
VVPQLLLPEQDGRRRHALDELSRLGASGLSDGRLVAASVFQRQGVSRASEALASAEALERLVHRWQANVESRRRHPGAAATDPQRRADGNGVAEEAAHLRAEVEQLSRERLGLARDRMVAETNLASIDRALVLADVLSESLRAATTDGSDARRAERAREALAVLHDRQQVLLEQAVAARQSIGAFELIDARLVAVAEAVTRALLAANAALTAEP